MVLSIEISDLLASFSSQAVQEGISWVVHHLGKCPQCVGNVASTELFCVLHCSTVPALVQPLRMLPMSKLGNRHNLQSCKCFCRAACRLDLFCKSFAWCPLPGSFGSSVMKRNSQVPTALKVCSTQDGSNWFSGGDHSQIMSFRRVSSGLSPSSLYCWGSASKEAILCSAVAMHTASKSAADVRTNSSTSCHKHQDSSCV